MSIWEKSYRKTLTESKNREELEGLKMRRNNLSSHKVSSFSNVHLMVQRKCLLLLLLRETECETESVTESETESVTESET